MVKFKARSRTTRSKSFKLDRHGYPVKRSSFPRWCMAAHIAGLILATYALGYPYA